MEIIKSQQGYLSVLGGKTDMGKSTISVLDCADKLRSGKSVIFFSYEYCQSIIYNKLVEHFGLKYQELFNLNVVDARSHNLDSMLYHIEKLRGSVDVVYIDYLSLVVRSTYKNYDALTDEEKVQRYQEVLEALAKVAFEQQIAIVILARLRTANTLDDNIEYLNRVTSLCRTPAEPIKMFIGKDEALNPLIKGTDMSHVILVDNRQMVHFSSINLKEAYKN